MDFIFEAIILNLWDSEPPVLVSSDCYDTLPKTGCLKQQKFISHSSGAGKSGSGEDRLPSLQMSIFLLCAHMAVIKERRSKLSDVSSYKGTNPIMRVPPSWPNYLPKAPSLNTITFGVRISADEFGGTQHSVHRTCFLNKIYFVVIEERINKYVFKYMNAWAPLYQKYSRCLYLLITNMFIF